MREITQAEIIMEFFKKRPEINIKHPEIVDWATIQYKKRTSKTFRDPDRQIRQLHQNGFLIKISKGVYKYDPKFVINKELENFTQEQKKQILKRDNFRCVICAKGLQDGVELHVDHIKPKDKGGKATLENGQILCAMHNFRKKNYKQTETGKKMFIRLYEASKVINDTDTINFCTQILKVFEKNNINGHIVWKK